MRGAVLEADRVEERGHGRLDAPFVLGAQPGRHRVAQFGEVGLVDELLGDRDDDVPAAEAEGLDAVLGPRDVLLHEVAADLVERGAPVDAVRAQRLDVPPHLVDVLGPRHLEDAEPGGQVGGLHDERVAVRGPERGQAVPVGQRSRADRELRCHLREMAAHRELVAEQPCRLVAGAAELEQVVDPARDLQARFGQGERGGEVPHLVGGPGERFHHGPVGEVGDEGDVSELRLLRVELVLVLDQDHVQAERLGDPQRLGEMPEQQQGALGDHRLRGPRLYGVQSCRGVRHRQQLLCRPRPLLGLPGVGSLDDHEPVPASGVHRDGQLVAGAVGEPQVVDVRQLTDGVLPLDVVDAARLQLEEGDRRRALDGTRGDGSPGERLEDRGLDVEAGGDADQVRDAVAAEPGLRLDDARAVGGQDDLGVGGAEAVPGRVEQCRHQLAHASGGFGGQRRREELAGLHEQVAVGDLLGGDADDLVDAGRAERLDAELGAVEELLHDHGTVVGEGLQLLLPGAEFVGGADQADARAALEAGGLDDRRVAEVLQECGDFGGGVGARAAHRGEGVGGKECAHRGLVVEAADGLGRVEGQAQGVGLQGGREHRGLLAEVQDVGDVVGAGRLADQGAQGGLVGEVGVQQLDGVACHFAQVVRRLEGRVPDRDDLEAGGHGLLHQLAVRLDHEDPVVLGHCWALSGRCANGVRDTVVERVSRRSAPRRRRGPRGRPARGTATGRGPSRRGRRGRRRRPCPRPG